MKHPIVGSIVHYVHSTGFGTTNKCTASIVTDVYDANTGNINVREMDNMQLRSTLYSKWKEPASWHWSEDCSHLPNDSQPIS